MADLDMASGDLDGAEQHVEAYLGAYEGVHSELQALGWGALGQVQVRRGRLEEGMALVDQALRAWPESCRYDYAVLLCRASEVRALAGALESALEALDEACHLMGEMEVGPESILGLGVKLARASLDS
jgi:ATP/maltotriose-dependent transcriptional regulator MalT